MKVIYKILLVLAFSIGTVVALYALQDKPVKSGFNRGQIYTLTKLDSLELKFNYWYINRLDSHRIYLCNYKAGFNLFSCNYSLQDTFYRKLPAKDDSRVWLEELRKDALNKIAPTDSGFGADGYLIKDIAATRLIYTFYYRNSYVCLDTGLRVLYTGKLIDTNTVAKIEVSEYKENERSRMRVMAAPAVIVNKRGCIDSGWFYNHSGLAADNEKPEGFNRHEVLDVYSLTNHKYSHSIYLPRYKKQDLTDFVVRGNLMIALYGKVLVIYKLPALKSER